MADLSDVVVQVLDVLATMGNGEGWTVEIDVVMPLWGALSPEDRARTGYDVETMNQRYEYLRSIGRLP